MKKTVSVLILLAMLFSLTACRDNPASGKADTEVDAASISEKIVPPSYSLKGSKSESDIWTSSSMSECDGLVYYIGSDSDSYHVCSFDPENQTNKVLFSNDEKVFWDVSADADGHIFLLVSGYSDNASFEVIELDMGGNEICTYPLNKLSQKDAWLPRQIECCDGKLFILGTDCLIVAELGLQLKKQKEIPAVGALSLSRSNEGILLAGSDMEGGYIVELYSTDKYEPVQTASFNMSFTDMSGGETWDVFLGDSNALYGYRFETNAFQKLFSWNGIGLTRGSIIEAGEKLICSSVSFDKPGSLAVLVPRTQSAAGGSVIRFATTDPSGINFLVQEAIRDWNAANPSCPIEIIDYSVYATADKSAATTKLMADIVAGNMPDIYDFSMTAVDFIPSSAQMARRGLLEDLYPYIDNDPELSREDFIPGVINSLEIGGGLYEVVPAISLVTTFAAASAVGSAQNWTYDNFNSIIESSSYFDSVFDKHNDRMWLLGNIVDASGDQLVNWTKGECYFESEYFRDILETMKAMPEKGEEYGTPTLPDEVAASTGLLYFFNNNSIWMASIAPQAFKEDYCFPGLPEIGSAIYPLCSYGISAYSQNKEQCWQFLRQFLTEEYKLKFSISPRMDGLREQISATWEEFEDVQQYHPHGFEAMNALADIIINADTVVRHDPQIWQIVYSETGAYFAGQRSVEETMHLIQSRASVYMAEQYG